MEAESVGYIEEENSWEIVMLEVESIGFSMFKSYGSDIYLA